MNVIVRIMPRGDEVEVELSPYSTGKEIITAMLDNNIAPKIDPEGNQYTYDLIHKRTQQKISDNRTLFDVGVKDGEVIYLAPIITAG